MARGVRRYLRNPAVVVVGGGARSIAIARGGAPVVLPIAGAALSELLARALTPVTAADLGAPARTVALLVESGVLIDAAAHTPPPSPADARATKPIGHLVLGVTGAINAVHSFAIASYLADYICDRLDVVLTRAARKIVRPAAYRYLGFDVWTDAFETRGDVNVPHVRLAAADLIAILPASARTLDKLARGACDDLLSLVVAATRAPVVVGPSMNAAMWAHAPIAENVARLRARGVYVIEPAMGTEVSEKQAATWQLGAMPIEPALIARALVAALTEARTDARAPARPATRRPRR